MKRPKVKAKVKKRKRSSGSKGKQKGSAFERQICKALSHWVSKGKHDDLFWRSAMSGGRATIGSRTGKDVRQAGDICSVSPEGHTLTDRFYVECKSYKDLRIDRFFIEHTGTLWQFWVKACQEARMYDRTPMLIVKQNTFPILVLVKPGMLDSLSGLALNQSICVPYYKPRYSAEVLHFATLMTTIYRG